MRAMDSRHDFTLEKVFWGYFGALDQKANSALVIDIMLIIISYMALPTFTCTSIYDSHAFN